MADLKTVLRIIARDETGGAITSTRKNVSGLNDQLRELRNQAIALVGINIGLGGLADIARLADDYALTNSRLKLLTGATDDFAQVQREVFSIAQATSTEYAATADLYGKITRATKALNVSQQDNATITQAINQALRISGSTGAEAAGFLRQFGQALSSGVLRGDEFNSVMEQGGRLAFALQDGLGKTDKELRAMAEAGELTADVLVSALLGQAEKIAAEYANLPPTIASAFAQLETAFTKYVGDANQGAGATKAFAEAISGIAENFPQFAEAVLAAGVAIGSIYSTKLINGMRLYAIQQLATIRSARSERQAAVENAQAKLAEARAAFASSRANFNMARNMDLATGSMARQSVAAADLRSKKLALAAAEVAATSSIARNTLAARAGAAVMGFLGGPIGIITTALTVGAVAWATWSDEAEGATKKAKDFGAEADRLLGNVNKLKAAKLEEAIGLGENQLRDDLKALQDFAEHIDAAKKAGITAAQEKALEEHLKALADQANKTGIKLNQLRQALQNLGKEQPGTFGSGTAGAIGAANDQLAALVDQRKKLVDDLNTLESSITDTREEPKNQSDARNISELNTLRGNAQTKIDQGDTKGALADLERAKQLIAAIAEGKGATGTYLQSQIDLVRDLADEIENVQTQQSKGDFKPKIDTSGVADGVAKFADLRDAFLAQNPGTSLVEIKPSYTQADLDAILAAMQATANQGITVPVKPAAAGGVGENAEKKATGGLLSGPGGPTSDNILLWGSPGEYMLRAAAVSHYGLPMIEKLNKLQFPRFANGGSIAAAPRRSNLPPLPSLQTPRTRETAVLNLTISGQKFRTEVSSTDIPDLGKAIDAHIRREHRLRGTRS